MNFDQIVAAVYLRLGVPSGDALFTSEIVGQAVNEAANEINSERDWPWLQVTEPVTTIVGTESYLPGGTWLRTRSLRIVGDQPLEFYTYDELNDMFPDGTALGRPQAFTIERERMTLRPVPDAVYTLDHRFIAEQVELVGEAEPLLPPQFHPAIASLAAHICLGRSREDARAASALNDYQRWLSKMQKFSRRYTGPGRIRSQWDG